MPQSHRSIAGHANLFFLVMHIFMYINTKKFEFFTRFVQYENECTHHTQFVCLILFVCCLKTIKQFSKIRVNSILALEFQSWYNPEVINKLQMKSNYFTQINLRNMINKHNMCYITKLLHQCIIRWIKRTKNSINETFTILFGSIFLNIK